ncbi:heavy metal-associated isoprenylated plant protein 19-like [Phragmites australis]|uniref:heavy metal-associated isoprenylated plant protein 19-like n=1 Tax=Phragmites australis TaxID=29695 RepID=UPI002D799E83|nr:heavy metal-associated isoprenylated plant protein 19-like [Phragmites australis]
MDEENDNSPKSITTELKVYMHCDACERSVRCSIKKIKGVETVEVDRDENKVTVTGDFEPKEVLKKIKKKTGKKAEILIPEENEEEYKGEEPYVPYDDDDPVLDQEGAVAHEFQNHGLERCDLHYFDDENTEACRIM